MPHQSGTVTLRFQQSIAPTRFTEKVTHQVSEKMDNRHHPGQGAAHSSSLAGMGILEAGKDLHERDKCVQGGSRTRGEDKCQGELRMRGR